MNKTRTRIVGRSYAGRVSSKVLRTLSDYCRANYRLRLDCACGRTVLLDPHKLMIACHRRGWSVSLEGLAMRLKCYECGERPKRIGPASGSS